jgi:hypothetical protein
MISNCNSKLFPNLGEGADPVRSSPSASKGIGHMDDTTSDTLDQADEEILSYTASDEAIEAAADTEKRPVATMLSFLPVASWCCS